MKPAPPVSSAFIVVLSLLRSPLQRRATTARKSSVLPVFSRPLALRQSPEEPEGPAEVDASEREREVGQKRGFRRAERSRRRHQEVPKRIHAQQSKKQLPTEPTEGRKEGEYTQSRDEGRERELARRRQGPVLKQESRLAAPIPDVEPPEILEVVTRHVGGHDLVVEIDFAPGLPDPVV